MSHSAADRISSLPCDVIDEILKYLPLDDAVRASILSREWRYKWITTPCLAFDGNFVQKLPRKCTIKSIVYDILMLYRGPIFKFKSEVFDLERFPAIEDLNGFSAIDHWLRFLSNYRVEELKLWFPLVDVHRPLPCHVFAFDRLRHLSLVNANLRPPSTFEGFGRLVTLDLHNVHATPGEFTRFVSKCPRLENLNLHSYVGTTCRELEIDAPNLKSFCFWGEVGSIRFKNTPLLVEVSLHWCKFFPMALSQTCKGNSLIECLGDLSSIERLRLSGDFLQFLAGGGEPPLRLPFNLSHLLVLHLSNLDFAIISEFNGALCLLSSSPNLQSLEITSGTSSDDYVESASEFLKAQRMRKLGLSRLENVTIEHFSGSEPEMEFVRLLLSAAAALVNLKIISAGGGARQQWETLKELTRFRRASPQAEIIFEDAK